MTSPTRPPPPSHKVAPGGSQPHAVAIEILQDLSAVSSAVQGFLRRHRVRAKTRLSDGTRTEPYIVDYVDRAPGRSDAVALAVFAPFGPGGPRPRPGTGTGTGTGTGPSVTPGSSSNQGSSSSPNQSAPHSPGQGSSPSPTQSPGPSLSQGSGQSLSPSLSQGSSSSPTHRPDPGRGSGPSPSRKLSSSSSRSPSFNATPSASARTGEDHDAPTRDCAGIRVLLRRQARLPVYLTTQEPLLVEAVAGIIEAPEDPLEAARRELLEETGLAVDASAFSHLGPPVFASPGTLVERFFPIAVALEPGALDDVDALAPAGDGSVMEEGALLLSPSLEEALHLTTRWRDDPETGALHIADAKTELVLVRLERWLLRGAKGQDLALG